MREFPKFYIDRQGKYDNVNVVCTKRRGTISHIQVYNDNYMVMNHDLSIANMRLFATQDSDIEVINEGLRQTPVFRRLMVVRQDGRPFVIVEGKKIPMVNGLELQVVRNEIYSCIPFKRPERKGGSI